MDRLGALDAEFLLIEDEATPMHIAGLATFEGPAPSLDELAELIASRLDGIPRYRQIVRRVPFELGRPVWIDDARFDLGRHLSLVSLPAPYGEAELGEVAAWEVSQPLDHARPLWEICLIDGMADGRWALLCKVHHCMVDGIAGVGLLTALLSVEDRVERWAPAPWSPRPPPGGVALVLDAWRGLAADLADSVSGASRLVTHPLRSLEGLGRTACGLAHLGRRALVPPHGPRSGSIGLGRVWARSTASLDDVRTIRSELGGTVNDVVVAAVAGGYRDLLLSRGENPDTARMRAAIPVSVRSPETGGVANNEVSTMIHDLAVHVADPVERLAVTSAALAAEKRSHTIEAGAALTGFADLVAPPIIAAATRLGVRFEHGAPQGMIDTVVTNVPGPQVPLYCRGRRMLAAWPYVGLSYGVRFVTAVLSYDGRLCFGVSGDRATSPDVDLIASGTVACIAELHRVALRVRDDTSTRPAGGWET